MTEEKKSFVLYYSMIEQVKRLNNDQIADLFRAILSTGGVCAMPKLDALTDMAFVPIRRELETNADKWVEKREKYVESGRKGGLKKAENIRKRNNPSLAIASDPRNASNVSLANVANLAVDVDADVAVDADADVAVANHSPVQHPPADVSGVCAAKAAPEGDVSHAQEKPALSKAAVQEHFEALWQLYPSKRGKNQVTERAKRALMAVSVEDMRTAIARYRAEVENAHFDRAWLNGSTWFGGRYEDYLGENYTPQPAVSHTPKTSRRARECAVSADEAERRSNYFRSREE